MIWEIDINIKDVHDCIVFDSITSNDIILGIEQCYERRYNMAIKPMNMQKFILEELITKAKACSLDIHNEYDTVIKYNDISNIIYMTCEIVRDYDLGCV